MTCPTCVSQSCPESVPEINIEQNTIDAASSLSIVVSDLVPADPTKKTISIQVADAGYWLLRVWIVDQVYAGGPTDQETLTPPTQPGASSFFKVTDSTGLCEFEVENATPDAFYIQAALCGAVVVSEVVVVGV